MTQQEILDYLATLSFICRGYLPTPIIGLKQGYFDSQQKRMAQLVDSANRGRSESEPYVHYVESRIVNQREELLCHLSDNTIEPYSERPPCGYDFKQTILSGLWDGELHKYTCPKCGVTGEYRAPLLTKE